MIDLNALTQMKVYPASVAEANGVTYFLGARDGVKYVACLGESPLVGRQVATVAGRPIVVGPTDHANAEVIRRVLPWTAPRCQGLATSAGMGDRLGLATPGHIRSVRATGVVPMLAQQSIREMKRTQRSPEQVIDAATWGVFQEGYRTASGFGSDADHIQQPEDLDRTMNAGFTMFTIDPGLHVVNEADRMEQKALLEACGRLDRDTLQATPADWKKAYLKPIALKGGGRIAFTEETLLRAAVKYGGAIAHTTRMYRRLVSISAGRSFELEVSVDETDSPTSPAEHYFFAAELRRLGVQWVSMAPRFIGRFEKGVDYIGDLDEFRASFKRHVAVMKTLGPYKMSIHSGSDKFSIYPIVAELAGELVHLKTAGTSYLEALRAVAKIDPALFGEILDFARQRYETDKATYHVSADVSMVKPAGEMSPAALPKLLSDFHARQVLHVTFGSVLTADDGKRFRDRMYHALQNNETVYYDVLETHLGKHVKPFAR